MAIAWPWPSPKSSLSHATIWPAFTSGVIRPFARSSRWKSAGVFPVFAWMLSMYAWKVMAPAFPLSRRDDSRGIRNSSATPASAQIQDAVLLGVLDADRLPRPERVLAEELVEEADPLGELARVSGKRLDLRVEEPGDVLGAVGLVRPAEPHVVDVLRLEALTELLAEEVRVAAAGEAAVERDPSGRPMVGVVVVAVLEEDRGRIAADHRFGADLADPAGGRLADDARVLELAVVRREHADAREPEHLGGGLGLFPPRRRELLTARRRIAGTPVAVREDQQVDLAPGPGPSCHRAAGADLGIVRMREHGQDRTGLRGGLGVLRHGSLPLPDSRRALLEEPDQRPDGHPRPAGRPEVVPVLGEGGT